jgi:hypothetical protein
MFTDPDDKNTDVGRVGSAPTKKKKCLNQEKIELFEVCDWFPDLNVADLPRIAGTNETQLVIMAPFTTSSSGN